MRRGRREDIPLLFDYVVTQSTPGMNRPAPATLHAAVESFAEGMIAGELRKQGANVSKTTKVLKIAKTTLFDRIRKADLEEQYATPA